MKRFVFTFFVMVFVLSFFMFYLFPPAKAEASSFSRYYYGSSFYFKVYVPNSYTRNSSVPLMVMLHGCTQDPDDFAVGTKMNQLAEEKNFIVLYPEMNAAANINKCWNWFYMYNQQRGSGEPAIIAGMTNWVKENYNIQSNHVFISGLSAGGVMSSIMGAAYPDLFSGVGISAGGMYKAATTVTGGFYAMTYGSPYSPESRGYDAYLEMGSRYKRMPVIVFHGTSDDTVNPVNATQAVQQWAETNDRVDDGQNNNSVDTAADTIINGTSNGRNYTKYHYYDEEGNSLIQYWKVSGLEHAWSGGNSNGSYTDPSGPDVSRIMFEFFMSQ
jgi:poly(hydroxyalkanoate) depolymerase family esterase